MRNPELEFKMFSLIEKIYDKIFEKIYSRTIEENLMSDSNELAKEVCLEMNDVINELNELNRGD